MINSSNRIPSIDGLRAVSILMVVGSHALGSIGIDSRVKDIPLISFVFNGDLGVKIFFVISGFIITHLLLREESKHGRISLKNFYYRRVIRIIPAYYSFLIILSIGVIYKIISIPVSSFIAALTFTTPLFGEPTWLLGHTWSLSVEEQFYLIWPLLLVLIKPSNRLYLTIIAVLVFPLLRVAFYLSTYRESISYLFITQGDVILWGCMAALVYDRFSVFLSFYIRKNIYLIRILCLFILIGIFILGKYIHVGVLYIPFANLFLGISIAVFLLSLLFHNDFFTFILNKGAVRYVGFISYSWYLWQQVFLTPAGHIVSQNSYYILIIKVVASFLCAVLSYHFIEMYFQKFKMKFPIRE